MFPSGPTTHQLCSSILDQLQSLDYLQRQSHVERIAVIYARCYQCVCNCHEIPLIQVMLSSSLFSRVRLFVTPWTTVRQALLSATASRRCVKFILVASMTLSSHLILCRPLLLLPSVAGIISAAEGKCFWTPSPPGLPVLDWGP